MLFLLPIATAECPEKPEDCTTSDGLRKMENPSLDDFRRLESKDEQREYLLSNYKSEFAAEFLSDSSFSEGMDIALGDTYFRDPVNINNPKTKEARLAYFQAKGYDFEKFEGDVAGWNPSAGMLVLDEGSGQGTKDLGALKDEYSFGVDDSGTFYLKPKGSDVQVKVQGDMISDGDYMHIDGEIEGNRFKGHVRRIGEEKKIYFEDFEEIHGTVSEGVSPGVYSTDDNSLMVYDTSLSQVGDGMTIDGEAVELPDGSTLTQGRVTWLDRKEGWECEKGTRLETPNDEEVSSESNPFNVYTRADAFDPQEHRDETFYLSGDEDAHLHATEGEEIDIEYLAGNELMHMFKRKYERDHDTGEDVLQDVPDPKQVLRVSASDGASLSIQKREGKIPLMSYTSEGDGSVDIRSGKLGFGIDSEGITLETLDTYETISDYVRLRKTGYRSVPFQLDHPDDDLLVNPANQFKIYGSGSDVAMNDYGIELTTDAQENYNMRSIDELREKYSNIRFNKAWMFNSNQDDDLEDVQTSTIRIIDRWLEEHEEAHDDITDIEFNYKENAEAISRPNREGTIALGELLIDHHEYANSPIRDIERPSTVITHEYEHLMDTYVEMEEEDMGIPDEERLMSRYNSIINQEFDNLAGTDEYRSYLDETRKRISIYEQVYNLEHASTGDRMKDAYRQSLEKSEQEGYGDVIRSARETIDRLEDEDAINDMGVKISAVSTTVNDMTYRLEDGEITEAYERAHPGQVNNLRDALYELGASSGRNTEEFTRSARGLEDLIGDRTEIEYAYNFKDYGGSDKQFSELSATFAERLDTPDERQKIRQEIEREVSGDDGDDRTSTTLAQLRFDSGKMTGEEFRELMPDGYCEEEDCCDRKCEAYTATCEGACD